MISTLDINLNRNFHNTLTKVVLINILAKHFFFLQFIGRNATFLEKEEERMPI